jgi:uncharacterized protein YgiM (DUF1202 family)
VRGKVSGVPAVNLREGPNPQSRAVAWLSEGEQVEIESVVEGWALVHTERGKTGYVRVTYLAAPEAALSRLEATQPPPPPTQGAPEAASQAEPALQSAAVIEAEMLALRSQLDEVRQHEVVTPGIGTPVQPEQATLQEIRRDLQILLTQTKSIEKRLGANSFPGDLAAPVRESAAFPWAVLGLGVFLGLVLGGAMGRRQERKKRTRIRI